MFFKKDNDKIDTGKINDILKIGKSLLQIIFILGILVLIAITSYLIKAWGILDALKTIVSVISPLFIGIVIAWLLNPGVIWLEKKGIRRGLSTVIVFVLFLSITVLVFYLFIPSFMRQIQDVVGVFPNLIENASSWIKGFFDKLSDLYNFDFSNVKDSLFNMFTSFSETITIGLPNKIVNIITSFLNGSMKLIIGLIIGFYMLFDFNNVRKQLLVFVPKRFHNDTLELTDNLNRNLKNYVQGVAFDTMVLFVFQTIFFFLAGLKAPLAFGLICAVTNIIPYIGPYIGGAPAVLVGFSISPTVGLFTLLAVVLSQALESYVLNPIIMSKTMKLHPVTIIIGLLIFGHFFGILGMILSTPIISCMKVVFNFFENKYEWFDKIKNE